MYSKHDKKNDITDVNLNATDDVRSLIVTLTDFRPLSSLVLLPDFRPLTSLLTALPDCRPHTSLTVALADFRPLS